MRFEVRIQKVGLPKAVSSYTGRRLHFSLSRFESRVRRVIARIFDINGPRGGVDKRCRITAHLLPLEAVIVKAVNRDLYAAIGRATERVAQTFTQRLTRRHDLKTKRESVRVVDESLRRRPAAQPVAATEARRNGTFSSWQLDTKQDRASRARTAKEGHSVFAFEQKEA